MKNKHPLNSYQINYPIAAILQDIGVLMSVDKPYSTAGDLALHARLCSDGAIDEISGWIEALGLLVAAVANHEEQSMGNSQAISIAGRLISSLTQIERALQEVKSEATCLIGESNEP